MNVFEKSLNISGVNVNKVETLLAKLMALNKFLKFL